MTSTSDEVGHTLDLDAIEARANAATPGPWKSGLHYKDAHGFKAGYVNTAKDTIAKTDSACSDLSAFENAEFIAHARTDIPALLTECRSLRNSHDSLVKALERVHQAFDITSKHFEEVEVDGEMIDPYDLKDEIDAALSQAKGGK